MLTDTEKKEKKIKYVTGLLSVILCVFVLFTPTAKADIKTAIKTSIKEAPYSMARQVTSGSTENIRLFLTDNNEKDMWGGQPGLLYKFAIGEQITTDSGDTYKLADIPQIKVFDLVIKILGFGIAIVLAFVRMFSSIEKGQDIIESILKVLIEVFVVFLVIINTDRILNLISQIGAVIMDALSFNDNVTDADLAVAILNGMGVKVKAHNYVTGLNWFKAVAMLIIPWALSFFVTLGGYFVAFSILFELMIRRIFTPLAIADIYGEGLRSPGMRYLKKYLAIFLKIAVCLVMCYLIGIAQMVITPSIGMDDISSIKGAFTSLGAVIGYLLMVIGLNFTGIGVMLKGGEIANEVAGA